MLNSAERKEIKRLRAEFKRLETERDTLKSDDRAPVIGTGSYSVSHE